MLARFATLARTTRPTPQVPPHPTPGGARAGQRRLLKKLAEFLHPGPDSTAELLAAFATAEQRRLIDTESRAMLEGVLRLADKCAGDVMLAAPRMVLLDIDAPYEELLAGVIDSGHSRFPVFQGSHENIIGMLMAKDLLKLQRAPDLNVRALLRPAMFVPEAKGLNDLLREFRRTHNHLAIVVDEFGRTAGLITIEDVLEEIVGEIEDEFDSAPGEDGDIFALADGAWRVSGDTPPEQVAAHFEVTLQGAAAARDLHAEFDTIGGLIAHTLGHVPVRGERCRIAGLEFKVLHMRGGAVRWFRVQRLPAGAAPTQLPTQPAPL